MSTPRRLVVPFTKMNGVGNDFIVIDNRFLVFSEAEMAAFAARLCPRRTGIGADGLLALEPPEKEAKGAHLRMRYRNADGSHATMCGNGARCLARFASRAGLGETTEGSGLRVVMDTDGGRYTAEVFAEPGAPVRLHVPSPRDLRQVTPKSVDLKRPLTQIWTGTEHVVCFTDDLEAEPVDELGRRIRQDPAFAPAGTNVNFVTVTGEGAIRVRTYEKGVEAETPACGTGALASALAAHFTERLAERAVRVEMPGGALRVAFEFNGDRSVGFTHLTLDGPAELVYEGTVEW